MKTARAGSFRSTDGEDFAPTLPQPVAAVLGHIASNRVHDLGKADIDAFAALLALAAKLGAADERAGLRDRSGVPLLRLFATVWTVAHERAVRNAYRAGRQHAELS